MQRRYVLVVVDYLPYRSDRVGDQYGLRYLGGRYLVYAVELWLTSEPDMEIRLRLCACDTVDYGCIYLVYRTDNSLEVSHLCSCMDYPLTVVSELGSGAKRIRQITALLQRLSTR